MILTTFQISLPDWVAAFVASSPAVIPSTEERMKRVIALATENVRQKTGGPFAAAVFERDSGALVSVGVNVVVPSCCSTAHAEMLALGLAQVARRTFDLGAPGMPAHELVTSAEPCAMCFGALPWSGIARLVCGATSEDVESLGFDEGPKPAQWAAELEARRITVLTGVCRDEATRVLRRYGESGGQIYNARPQRREEHKG